MFQGFISKFTKNNLVKTAAAACIAASVAFADKAQIGTSSTYWELADGVLTISGTGAMPTDFTYSGSNNPWYSQRASITSVVIEDGVMTIGQYTFYQHTGLTSVTIGNSVTSIGQYAFSYCTGLTSVTIPNSVTSIGDEAFYECTKLTTVTIPASVTSIGSYAFYGCTGLTAINVDASNASYSSVEGVLFNKAKTTLIQYPAGKTGAYTIPASVTSIRDYAFSGCAGLTSVTIPASVTSIGYYAFNGCSELVRVDFNATNCTSMGSYEMGGYHSAFYNCGKLSQLNIGNNVTNIPAYAFSGCSGLTSVTIPNSVTFIGNYAFNGCSELVRVDFNATNCTYMGTSSYPVFNNCGKLSQLNIGNNVTNIPAYAFSYCSGLTGTLTIPNFVTSIGERAFSGCSGLTGTLTIPNSVTSIGSYAFQNCDGLREIVIPNSAASIGKSAFKDCSGLTSVTIGNSVKEIGEETFYGCSNITQITNHSVEPQSISSNVFRYIVPSLVKLYVPYQALDAYKVADVWKGFDVREITGETTKTKIAKPVVYATLLYTGKAQSAGIVPNTAYEVSGDIATDVGIYTAFIMLKDTENYEWNDGTTTPVTLTWQIVKAGAKEIKVVWGEKREFVYNKMVQVPQWSIEPAEIDKENLRVVNAQSAVGNYTKENNLAPFIMILPEFNKDGNYYLTNTSVNYEITKKPLDIILKDNKGNVGEEIQMKKDAETTVGDVLDSLKAFIVYNGFAIDTVSKQADNAANSLSGEPTFEISKATRSIGNGDYLVKIKTDGITAKNYTVKEREIRISVGDNGISFATPINKPQKSDGRFGIRLSKNIVSDKAEFEVILPSDKVLEVKAVIYDNTGNVVFEKTERGASVSWNLTNAAGRNVANGTYLIVAEAKGVKGTYAYSAKVGVKR